MDVQGTADQSGFRPLLAQYHGAQWQRVRVELGMLGAAHFGGLQGWREISTRLDALKSDARVQSVDLPGWYECLNAIKSEIRALLRKPVAAHAGRTRQSAKLASTVTELDAAYDRLRPAMKRPAWIAARAGCGVSTVNRALAGLRRQG